MQLIEVLEPLAAEYAAEEERSVNKACCVVS